MRNLFNKHWFLIISFFVILLAGALRFYKLAEVPHGMTWDEAAIGYNGYAIFNTRRDEWLQRLPVSFRSFGDYKAPLAIYGNGVFTYVFGMNLWAVRLPFAICGVLAVWGMIILVRQYGRWRGWSDREKDWFAIVAGLMLAVSPWHLNFSRAGYESGMSLAITIWAGYFLLRFLQDQKFKYLNLFSSVILFALTFYTYHSSKLVTPLLVVMILIFFSRKVIKEKWLFLIAGITGTVGIYPLINDSFFGKGLERASTLIFSRSDSASELIGLFLTQLFAHFDPSFLVLGKVTTIRNGDGVWGVFLPITFLLLVLSVVFALKYIFKSQKRFRSYLFAFAWVVIGIAPAALGAELVPHSNRALLALPGFILLAVTALNDLSEFVKKSNLNKKLPGSHGEKNMLWVSVMGMMIFLEILFFVKYLNNYYSNYSAISADAYNDGYLEAFNYVKEYEQEKEKILFTDEYGQPYIYALFARQTNPIWYQGGSLVKYEFSSNVNVGDLERENTVIVAGEKAPLFDEDKADKVVYGSDGQPRFKIYIR